MAFREKPRRTYGAARITGEQLTMATQALMEYSGLPEYACRNIIIWRANHGCPVLENFDTGVDKFSPGV